MAVHAAESVPVRFGPMSDWNRLGLTFTDDDNDHHRQDNLPKDPRQWSREDVAKWLALVTLQNRLPKVCPTRFQMNGKALCLMSLNMFLSRVPLGGKQLYKDFQLRLCTALYSPNQ